MGHFHITRVEKAGAHAIDSDCYVPASMLPGRTRSRNLRPEVQVASQLLKSLAEDPPAAVRGLLDIAQDLCNAGSAGMSLVHADRAGHSIIRWEVVRGALSAHEAAEAPRGGSPCGLCLDVGIAVLIPRPQQAFGDLADRLPIMAEVLTTPLYDDARKPLGTLWVAHHESNAHFDSEDVRIVEQLARQLVLALQERAHVNASVVLQPHPQAQQNLLHQELYQERAFREQAEIEHRQALRFKDALIAEINHRTKNSLQMASALLSMQARASSSAQVTEVLLDSAARLHVLAKVHELLYANSDSTQNILMPQLLKSVGDALRQAFGRQHPLVMLEIACDCIELPTEQAVALALITNESVTNAYKHAFAIRTAGAIAVRLQRTQEGAIRLQIEDTGSGFAPPDGVESMGMKLIRSFADQLRGTLDVTGRGSTMGTAITLTLPGRVSV